MNTHPTKRNQNLKTPDYTLDFLERERRLVEARLARSEYAVDAFLAATRGLVKLVVYVLEFLSRGPSSRKSWFAH